MRLLLALLALGSSLFLAACTFIPTQHGTAQFWGDYSKIYFHDGSVTLSADTMTHSVAVREHWHGVTKLGGEVVAGLATHGGSTAVTSAVGALPAFVNRDTNRATPTPTPKPIPKPLHTSFSAPLRPLRLSSLDRSHWLWIFIPSPDPDLPEHFAWPPLTRPAFIEIDLTTFERLIV